jgi:membrane protease YdiL (CAAX protease family)
MTTIPLAGSGPEPMTRPTALRRAVLFVAVCSPIWLGMGMLPVAHPVVMLAIALAATRDRGRAPTPAGRPIAGTAGWRRARELALGFGGGVLLIGASAIAVRLLLPLPWAWNPDFALDAAALSLASLLCGNAVEELVFRGYSFERLIAGVGHWRAQLATALAFAAFHVAQGWPWQVALLGTTVGSLFFGLVFVRWRSVPAAAGAHAAVNWARGLLLQDPPTAATLFAPLSPRRWTSGEQLVAGTILTVVMLIACVLLWRSIVRCGRTLSGRQASAAPS